MKKFAIALGVATAAIIVTLPMTAMSRGGGMGLAAAGPVKRSELEAAIKTRFVQADTNRDGFLTTPEMQANREKAMAERRANRFTALDTNKDGNISRDEFGQRPAAVAGETKRMGMRGGRGWGGGGRGGKAGTGRDANSDGKISLAEALARPLERFDAADANKDGTLTVEERSAARGKFGGNRRGRRGSL